MPGKFFGVSRLPYLTGAREGFHQLLGRGRESSAPKAGAPPGSRTALFPVMSWGALAAVLTLIAAVTGLRLQLDGVALFWPAAGIITALMLLTSGATRWGAAAGILLALSIANSFQDRSLATSMVFMSGNIIEAIVIAKVLDRTIGRPFQLNRLNDVAAFLAAALGAPAIVGLWVSFGLRWTGHVQAPTTETLWVWASSQAVGIATVAPIVLQLGRIKTLLASARFQDAVFVVAVGTAAIAVIGITVPETSVAMLIVLALIVPLLLWVMLGAGPARAALALLIIACVTIWTAGHSGLFAGSAIAAQIFLFTASAILLSLGAWQGGERPVYAGPNWLRSIKMSNFRAAVILLPLLLLPAFAWWTWRNVQQVGNERAQRVVLALADQTHRVLDVQETMLKSALARVRGQTPEQIASDASLQTFLADLSLGISGDLMIVDPGTRRILASSRGAQAEAGLSEAWPPADHDGVYLGELTSLGPGGETGFTVSQRDRRSGIIAVSWLSFDDSIPFYSGISQSSRDAVILARSDGAVLLMRPPDLASVDRRLGADSIFMRWLKGDLSMPTTAISAEDGVVRLWQIKEIEGHPVYAIFGLDASSLRSDWLREVAPFGLLALFSSGALMFLTDRLQRSAAEAETARAEAKTQRATAEISKRLELALRASSTGVWEWNPGTDALTCSNELLDILGMRSFDETAETFRQLVHPDDIHRVREATGQAVGKGEDFTFEFRIKAGDGAYRWLFCRGRATYDPSGKPTTVLGTVTDVTARKQAEEKLRQSEARYRMLHESLRDAFVQVALDGRILEFNDLYCQMLGYSPEEVRTLTYQELTPERWHAFEEGIIAGSGHPARLLRPL